MADEYYLCPKCGNDVKVGSPYCPTCTPPKKRPKKASPEPWQQDDYLDAIDLPDEDFDYEEFTAREFGSAPPHRQIGIAWYWWATAAALLIGFLAVTFR